ncbi:exosortase X [Crocinitomix algicola]|uniref:exosortase X n=1 Tax=Crocinitomix algicola TaxID=1740263 RepID=UPI00082C60C9|nr:archaeosortase/exosortase family protein [Crocinitomix algicola]
MGLFEGKQFNSIARFLIIAASLYTLWLLAYYLLIKPYTDWDYWISYSIVYLSREAFSIFDVITHIDIESDHVVLILDGGNNKGIWVGHECNGFKLFSIFSIFILAFPGKWLKKLWYIPMGLIIIHAANVLRIMILVLINNYYPKYLDFNHLYTFTIFVYSVIFALWYFWAKKYTPHESKS